jgi:CubicO group peptidase (beta-lactamase class C family)/D-alanyl-D-alanine dipeptidase
MTLRRRLGAASLLAASLACARPAAPGPRGAPPSAAPESSAAFAALDAFVRHEMEDKNLPALAVAVVDGERVVWEKAYGSADPEAKRAADRDTVYRVGSVSKLFTDIGVMQLVEKGELDLDAPIDRYLPSFRPKNPFGGTITLRELMAHRSGLVREPPVGHYFDATGPTLAATVASLNETELVYPPGGHTKYSNAGIAVVGRVLEARTGEPFEACLARRVLRPMGLSDSAFEPDPRLVSRLAKARMWSYDGLDFEAPTFPLGMAPAGSLYATVGDLARFVAILLARGVGPSGPILRPETLETMWKPQFAKPGEKTGYGLGFHLSALDGRRAVGHGGAIYGFATSLLALPDDRLGAAAVTTADGANAVTERIVEGALRLLLANRTGAPLPRLETTAALSPDEIRAARGAYGRDGKALVDLLDGGGELSLLPRSRGFRSRLRRSGDELVADSRLAFGTRVAIQPNRVRVGDAWLDRFPSDRPAAPPSAWTDWMGEYGWDYDVLYLFEKDGRPTALIEWFEYDPLTEVSDGIFRFPDAGLYDHETLTLVRDAAGRVTGARVGAVLFPRRQPPAEPGSSFRIEPLREVEELRREALAASPPPPAESLRAADLVELTTLDPTIRLDVRYASSNNFLGVPVYLQARAFLQRPAAEALVRAHRRLEASGYGLLIHDAYRPWYVTKMFWDATPPDKHIFVADPAKGSKHNRGCAVDLTLYERASGNPVVMTGVYDEMSERSYADYPAGTSLHRWQRDLLRHAMEEEGFQVYEYEWWHFDYRDWEKYPVLNVPFEGLARVR